MTRCARTAALGTTLALTMLVLSSCTFRAVKPEVNVTPTQKYATFVLGEIKMADKTWEALQPHFRKGVIQWLNEKKAFETVAESPISPVPASTITLSGAITEVDKGSTALRWIVGMGAGQAKVKGVFEIRDSSGQTLVKFEGRESYLGGAGIGGAGFLDMEDLTKRFGETVAEMTVK